MEDPLANVYTPHKFQVEAHGIRTPILLVLGGNRTGKTYFAVAESQYVCLGRAIHAEVPDPPTVVWYVMPTLKQFQRAIVPIINQLIPRDQVELTRTGKLYRENERIIRYKNGSELHFMSADMRQRRMQGASVDLVICDEPLPKTVFEELQARVMDRRGRIILVLTPVDDKPDNWIWIRDDLYIPYETGERKDIQALFMPVADEEGHSLVPHFTDEDILRMQEQWPDPAVQRARMYGHFVTRTGLVFGSFDKNVHVIPRFDIPPNWARWWVVDPQYHRFAALLMAADTDGNYYVTEEYFSQDEPLAHRAARMKALTGEVDGASVPVYVDSAVPQDIAELNWHFDRIGAKLGAMKLPMQKKVHQMVLKVHSMLEPDVKREYAAVSSLRGIKGAPRLLFFDTLKSSWELDNRRVSTSRLLWEMSRLVWDKNGKPEKDSAGGADATDCLIYGCSIMASAYDERPHKDEYEGMSQTDIILYEAIKQADARRHEGRQWRHLR